jgi:hypothetical protein
MDGLNHQTNMGYDTDLFQSTESFPDKLQLITDNTTNVPIVCEDINGEYTLDCDDDVFALPKWQSSPVLLKDRINVDINHQKEEANSYDEFDSTKIGQNHYYQHMALYSTRCIESGRAVISNFDGAPPGTINDTNKYTARLASITSYAAKQVIPYSGSLVGTIYLPIFNTFGTSKVVVGIVTATIVWDKFLENILPVTATGVIAVVENTCDGSFTYEINGRTANPIGFGDLHNNDYNRYKRTQKFETAEPIVDGTKDGLRFYATDCFYALHVYPSTVSYSQFLLSYDVYLFLFLLMMNLL